MSIDERVHSMFSDDVMITKDQQWNMRLFSVVDLRIPMDENEMIVISWVVMMLFAVVVQALTDDE